jgi:hypothetical protein
LQSVDIDFIAANTRSAVASGNGTRTGIDQMVASDLRAEYVGPPPLDQG